MKQAYDAIVIGGGFFGCKLSLYLKQYLRRILIVEKEIDLLQRASYVNQARVHNGYHYPRSILTGLRSKVNFPKFINEYQDCVDSSFDKYYAIGKILSKVTANQFKLFCQRIDVPVEPAPQTVKKLFNYTIIEEVFRTQEYAFDAVKLKNRVSNELEAASIEIQLNSQVVRVKELDNLGMEVFIKSENNCNSVTAKYVFNCTYSGINQVLRASDLPIIPLKHELAEMALVAVPEPLKHLGITVMCGPFFSIMPFPSRELHTLSHVRYTPHCYWQDTEDFCVDFGISPSKIPRKTNYLQMVRDAARYMPILEECLHVDSIWEVKTVLPQSEVDDSRPILFKKDQGIKNLTCILGGKIDNVYDIPDELQFLTSKESISNGYL